jgi:hypothetical protein
LTPPTASQPSALDTRPTRRRRYLAKRREYPPAPLAIGGHAIYLRSDDVRPMRVVGVGGGVVKLERDGARFEEPAAKVRGLRV